MLIFTTRYVAELDFFDKKGKRDPNNETLLTEIDIEVFVFGL